MSVLLLSFFFDREEFVETANVYKKNTDTSYKGKIYGKYGLGDKTINIAEFGTLERCVTGEEFFLIQDNNFCGLSVANDLDASLN